MVISLEGYEQVFRNAVYSKNIKYRNHDLKEILILSKYKKVSEDEIYEFLYNIFLKSNKNPSLGKEIDYNHKWTLEEAITHLPEEFKTGIIEKNEIYTAHLRDAIPLPNFSENYKKSEWLLIKCGILPLKFIEDSEKKGYIENMEWYELSFMDDKLREMGFGEKWHCSMIMNEGLYPLDSKNSLPKLADLEFLIDRKVDSSGEFFVSLREYKREPIKSIIKSVHQGIKNEEELKHIKDSTMFNIENLSAKTISTIYKNLERGRIILTSPKSRVNIN